MHQRPVTGRIGKVRMRAPVALKMALPIAAGAPPMVGSPAPQLMRQALLIPSAVGPGRDPGAVFQSYTLPLSFLHAYRIVWRAAMPLLAKIAITFYTHDDNKDQFTVLHVFVKNRANTSRTPDSSSDFISNLLESERYIGAGDLNDGRQNPYLAIGVGMAATQSFDDPSTHVFDTSDPHSGFRLRPGVITSEEIILPSVDIHILPADDEERWIFDYTVVLTFDDASQFTFTSKEDGVTGIILDADNRDHSGIGIENPLHPIALRDVPATNALLTKVTIEFATHDDDKDHNTKLDVHIVNRLDQSNARDLAIGLDLFKDEQFPDAGPSSRLSYRTYSWSADQGTLSSNGLRLADMVLPVVNIAIRPDGDDRWMFDYRVSFEFKDPVNFANKPLVYSSRTNGVVLDQDNRKHKGVYQGSPFPSGAAPTAPPLQTVPAGEVTRTKSISIALLQRKLDEFINRRNGADDSHSPPLMKVRLHNGGTYEVIASNGGHELRALPESYLDLKSIATSRGTVSYASSPGSLGQLRALGGFGDTYFQDINSSAITIFIDPAQKPPVTLTVNFETDGPKEIVGSLIGGMDLGVFSLTLKLTLDVTTSITAAGAKRSMVDTMSWVDEIQHMKVFRLSGAITDFVYDGSFLGQPVVNFTSKSPLGTEFTDKVIQVNLKAGVTDAGDISRSILRDKILEKLSTPDIITGKTARDGINAMVTSWLLGGFADDERNLDGNNTTLQNISFKDGQLVITYTGPTKVFVPAKPADWPTPGHPNSGHDFSPGTLSNVDHIVVVTMENRSFDHMLGYLSLPVAKGGMGRTDVDGLKGDESNTWLGKTYPSFALTKSLFEPDPPHSHDPVLHAINGGRMDGFVKSFGEERGLAIAGQIMGHHTAATVPTFDALARDYSIGHRWFAAHPGPTFCNRFYELTGRLNLDAGGFWELDNSGSKVPVFTSTIFDLLKGAVDPVNGKPVTWRYFESGYCFLRFFEQHTFDETNIVATDDAEKGFYALARAGNLPSISFIDPHFIELPPDAVCDGPPADVKDGQAFIRKVVEAVVASPAWNKTLLVIVYDEHGGFYDHVPPPVAAKVSPELPISTRGVRVPAFVVSPLVGAGAVFGHDGPFTPRPTGASAALHFDHTSILKTIVRRFLSSNPPYLGARFAEANDLSSVLGTQLRQPQFRPFIRYQLQCRASQMMLDVHGGNGAAGTALGQFTANATPAQDFSFEDAGGGFVYIRSLVSNLYVTAHQVASGNLPNRPAAAAASLIGIVQDVKYGPPKFPVPGVISPPTLQRWMLTAIGITTLDANVFVIHNEAYPQLVLLPATPSQPGSLVGLGAEGLPSLSGRGWRVSSQLLNSPIVATH